MPFTKIFNGFDFEGPFLANFKFVQILNSTNPKLTLLLSMQSFKIGSQTVLPALRFTRQIGLL